MLQGVLSQRRLDGGDAGFESAAGEKVQLVEGDGRGGQLAEKWIEPSEKLRRPD